MKTRIIQTRFWDDEFVSNCDLYTQHLYIYLLTCQYVNISGMFQLPTKKILLEANLTENQFNTAKYNLEKGNKVKFCDGWIYIINACKNNKYTNSPDNMKAYHRELSLVPSKVRSHFDSTVESSVDSTVGVLPTVTITHNSELITNNKGVVKGKYSKVEDISDIELEELSTDFDVPLSFVKSKLDDLTIYCESKGKTYKNYLAALRNFVKQDSIKIRKEERYGRPEKRGVDASNL